MDKTYDAVGRLLVEISSVSCISDTYDAAGRLTSETQQILPNNKPKSVIYHYDGSPGSPGKDGLRTSVDYPYGSSVAYGYSGRNQINAITSGAINATYVYDLDGNESTRGLNNGASESCGYNDVDHLTSLNHTANSASFSRFDYTHNKVNDCLTRTETAAGVAKLDKFAYDLDDQVTEARYNVDEQHSTQDRLCNYAYDATGNRMTMNDNVNGNVSYAVNNLNQYTAAGGGSMQYDLNGNLNSATVAGTNWTYLYDAQNRLISAISPTEQVDFAYDPKNRCVSRTVSTGNFSTVTYFYYDGWEMIEEHDASAALLARYIHGAREDEMIAKIDSYGTVYYHTDAEGSVAALTDASGNVIERYTYDAFGAATVKDANGTVRPAGTAYGNRFTFTGREWLPDLGLYDYRNRVYSPELGRFLQTDPKSFDADPSNLYRYCGNEPIDRTDPMGLEGDNLAGGYINQFYRQSEQEHTEPDTRTALERSRVYEGIREQNLTARQTQAREQAKSVRIVVRTEIQDNSVGQAGMKTKQVVNLNQDGTYTSSSSAGTTNIGITRVKGEFHSSTNVTSGGAPGAYTVEMRGYAVSRPLMLATGPSGYVLFSIHYSVNVSVNFSNHTAVGHGLISGYPSSYIRVGGQRLFHHQEGRIPLVDLLPGREVPVEGHTGW